MKKKQYLCSARPRQASPRCSNVRVVLFLYNEHQNPIPEALQQFARPRQTLAVTRLDGYRPSQGRAIPRIYRLLSFVGLYVSTPTDAKGTTPLQAEYYVRPSDDALSFRQEITFTHLQRD